jgi:oxalate decarboxylase/phosphoglucose isomerase-like protein (cupin superfamily)
MHTADVWVGATRLRLGDAGRPLSTPGLIVEERRVRRRSDLRAVADDPAAATGRTVQYWMWNGVAEVGRAAELAQRPVRFELTFLADRPLGQERPKTSGHVHVRPAPGRPIYPELCQVLVGRAGFLVQDLGSGPSASYAVLVVAGPGDTVVLPPGLHHGTINLAEEPLVFADVIDRRAAAEYGSLGGAHGFAYRFLNDGTASVNPAYVDLPALERVSARDWSGPGLPSIYDAFAADPAAFPWLREPEAFAEAFPELAKRIEPVLNRISEPL